VPTPIARWNPARSVWETNETLICGHSDVWSETWMSSGTWADGLVYELPMSVPPTEGSASSSPPGLLPMPKATDGTKGGPNQRGSSGDLTLPSAAVQLLPTPRTTDGNGAGHHGTGGMDLRTTVTLLPTPTETDAVVRTSLGASTNPRFDAGSD
jgi:hypothetical protein